MTTQQTINTDARYIELDTERKIRVRNKLHYRFNHWPIWVFVFFIAPGPWTYTVFEHGFNGRTAAWLAVVMAASGYGFWWRCRCAHASRRAAR